MIYTYLWYETEPSERYNFTEALFKRPPEKNNTGKPYY